MTKSKKILSIVLISVLAIAAILVLCSCSYDEWKYHGNGVYAILYSYGDATVYAFDKASDVDWYEGQTCIVPSIINDNGKTYTVTAFGNLGNYASSLVLDGGHAREIVIPETVTDIYLDSYSLSDTYDYLERFTVASDNYRYKSLDGVLYSKNGEELLMYPPAKRDKTLVIPSELAQISQEQYNYCNKYIENIVVEEGNGYFSVIDNALYSANGKTLVFVPAGHGENLALPDGISTIDYYALRYANIVNLYIPQHIWRDEVNDYQFIMQINYHSNRDSSEYHPFRYVQNIYFYDEELPKFLQDVSLPYTEFHFGVSREAFEALAFV